MQIKKCATLASHALQKSEKKRSLNCAVSMVIPVVGLHREFPLVAGFHPRPFH